VMRAPSSPAITPTIAGAPTTLSGAASQSVIQQKKPGSKRVLAIALGAIAAGGIVLAVALSGGSSTGASSGEPKAAGPAPTPVEVAKPVPPPAPKPQPVVPPPAPVVETPTPVEVAKPVEVVKPVEKPKPVIKKPAVPTVNEKKKPPTTKQPLLETDI